MLALAVYDALIASDDEWRYIWRSGRFTIAKLSYIFVRYAVILICAMDVVGALFNLFVNIHTGFDFRISVQSIIHPVELRIFGLVFVSRVALSINDALVQKAVTSYCDLHIAC